MWKQVATTDVKCEGVGVYGIEPCTFKVNVDVLSNR
jgi:hypothetical protein